MQIDADYRCDVLIIGGGVIGLSIAIALLRSKPSCKVIVAEKEDQLGMHASGRNSGVLHAGFYYTPESLKAKFCKEGNQELRILASKHNIPVHQVGKIVVTRNQEEESRLDSLFQRGSENGVDLQVLDKTKLEKLEPLANTAERFLWSPTTAISSPEMIIQAMKSEVLALGGKIHYGKKVKLRTWRGEIYDSARVYDAKQFINAAGANADIVSRLVGIGGDYAMIPFMGVYKVTTSIHLPLRHLVYPVPHPVNPFLGVHFTLTLDGKVKIGPTAIPVAGREQYEFQKGWSLNDILQSLKGVTSLVRHPEHDFGKLVRSEVPKLLERVLVGEASSLVPSARMIKDWHSKPPGIRAQLVHLPTGKLVQDFIVTRHLNSVHVLNAVSPGWTSSLPFGKYVVEKYILE